MFHEEFCENKVQFSPNIQTVTAILTLENVKLVNGDVAIPGCPIWQIC